MKIEDVDNLEPLERYVYWVKERHQIYLRKEAGARKPWTDDGVFQRYFFTNPYRENDKTTKWFKKNLRDPLKKDPEVLMATVIFRWFNLPKTAETLGGLLTSWNEKKAVNLLTEQWEGGNTRVFTGAYMICSGHGARGSKIGRVCGAITHVWNARQRLLDVCKNDCRLEALWAELKKFKYLGGFMSYEVVCDLRHTALLSKATDIDVWCNQGPGARRGLNRILGNPLRQPFKRDVWESQTKVLLRTLRRELPHMPHFEMREVEHALCETAKYEAGLDILMGRPVQIRVKRRYYGAAD